MSFSTHLGLFCHVNSVFGSRYAQFSQLEPEEGFGDEEGAQDNVTYRPEPSDEQEAGEASQGFLLWRRLGNVISLDVNIRAPGVLGRLLSEMRSRSISDEMWRLYSSRVLSANDPRLQQPPFSTETVN